VAVRVHIVKEATPEQLGWRARIAHAEKPLIAAFLLWVEQLHEHIDVSAVAHAVITRSAGAFDYILQAVSFQPVLRPVTLQEAEHAFEDLVRNLQPSMRLSFDLHDPHFDVAVRDHQARLVREVNRETRRGIANMIERGYRQGMHPYDVAPQIRAAVGLTSRQAQAVLNYGDAMTKRGVKPQTMVDRTMRYAERMRTRRARTVARTETARAAISGRVASYEQAAARGLFDTATAELEWSAVQDDPTEICAQLDGTRVPFGTTFDGLLPPAHPNCRCAVHLVLPAPAARPRLTLAR
jgi:SPP1 gp7 family putative phage head morphogenesis protein